MMILNYSTKASEVMSNIHRYAKGHNLKAYLYGPHISYPGWGVRFRDLEGQKYYFVTIRQEDLLRYNAEDIAKMVIWQLEEIIKKETKTHGTEIWT